MFSYPRRAASFVWGHRGVPSAAIENTLASFARVANAGLDGFEFDVQFSQDRVPFVFHDDTLERLAGVNQVAQELSWSALSRLTLRDPSRPDLPGEAIPTLEQVLAAVPKTLFMNLELKGSERVTRDDLALVWNLLREHGVAERTLISSFHHPFLRELSHLAPDASFAALWATLPTTDQVAELVPITRLMHVRWQPTLAEAVNTWHQCGCQVAVFGVGGADDVRLCRDFHIDAVFIDDLAWLSDVGAAAERDDTFL